jgi:hypothetical protein
MAFYLGEKFTRERSAARKLAGVFPKISEGSVSDQGRELAPSAVGEHRIQDEAAALADRS